MALVKVVMHQPVRLGKQLYAKSAKPVEIDEIFLKGKWAEAMLKSGGIAIVAEKPAASPAPAAKAK